MQPMDEERTVRLHPEEGGFMTQTAAHRPDQRTGWVGWIYFAGILLLIGAAIDIIYGLAAIIGPNSAYFVGPQGGVAAFDVARWGWWSLVIGLALVVVAFFLLTGRVWARVLVAVVAAINAVSHILLLPEQPWWSLIMIGLDVLVIFAVTVHGGELRTQRDTAGPTSAAPADTGSGAPQP
jgi:hypothetical protein